MNVAGGGRFSANVDFANNFGIRGIKTDSSAILIARINSSNELVINENANTTVPTRIIGDYITLEPTNFLGVAAEAVRIIDGGNVGIGTSAPEDKLDIVGQLRISDNKTANTNKTNRIRGEHYNIAEEPNTFMFMNSFSTTNTLNIGGGSSIENAATQLNFYTAANNTTTTGSARMSITSAGNVGIGTTSPAVDLEIKTATNNSSDEEGLRLYNAGGGIGSGVRIGLGVGSTYDEKGHIRTDIVSGGAGRLFLGSNGTDRLVINENGKVLVNGAEDNSGKADFAASGGTVLAGITSQVEPDIIADSNIFDDRSGESLGIGDIENIFYREYEDRICYRWRLLSSPHEQAVMLHLPKGCV